MTEGQFAVEDLEALPLFPLPKVVFFPDTKLPLHIFEPRYRDMIRHCMDRKRPLAVAMIQSGHETEQMGNPPFCSVASAGRIVHCKSLHDGRYQIILQGLARVHIEDELKASTSYRQARAVLLPDDDQVDEHVLREKASSVRVCMHQLAQRIPRLSRLLESSAYRSSEPAVLANRLAPVLVQKALERQRLLECLNPADRLDRVLSRLGRLLTISLDTKDPVQ